MSWFRVDDTLAAHPKTRRAGLAAMGLWTVAGSWSSQQLTEGFVPDWFVATWPQGKKLAAQLVTPATGTPPSSAMKRAGSSTTGRTRTPPLRRRRSVAARPANVSGGCVSGRHRSAKKRSTRRSKLSCHAVRHA
jgi:hypothetical protein